MPVFKLPQNEMDAIFVGTRICVVGKEASEFCPDLTELHCFLFHLEARTF
jgi:hypothetical protein